MPYLAFLWVVGIQTLVLLCSLYALRIKAESPIVCWCYLKKRNQCASPWCHFTMVRILCFRLLAESFLIPACRCMFNMYLSEDCFVNLSLYLCLSSYLSVIGAFVLTLLKAKEGSHGEGMRVLHRNLRQTFFKGFCY